MCIICASPKGSRQPSIPIIRTMFTNNPHGAGYMYARNGKVHIHKGFMDVESFIEAIKAEHFKARDAVVYHFRISTQAGVTPSMTHPFPLSDNIEHMNALDVECGCGVAHNGVIRLTSDFRNQNYSDTALFIAEYLSDIIRDPRDLKDERTLRLIRKLAGSKLAIMDNKGYIATVGDFVEDGGLLFSNYSYDCRIWRAI